MSIAIFLEVLKPAPVHFCTDFPSTATATVSTYGRVVLRLGTFLQAVCLELKPTLDFRLKDDGVRKSKLHVCGTHNNPNTAEVEASHLVVLRIDRTMKPHTVAEELLLPVAKDIVGIMIGEDFENKLNSICISNDIPWLTKYDENRIYILPTLSGLSEENDVESDQRNIMMITVKECFHMLGDEIS
ncbi:hypothetical protein RF11_00184 [Thelohanellus kitauei]|uniref:Uncharacterized protein n=1 Tax=Thelohanellus kitauei TaxID=669202 RepID=A0A0C2IY68_THEKT|nr:hypothetical protein RF11_00184 [Thelohanellus kitauei]